MTQDQSQATSPTGLFEGRPTDTDPMNVASYAHLSANHIVNIALRQIRDSGVPARDQSQALVRSVSSVIWNVVTTVQEQMLGFRHLQAATSRNLLYSLGVLISDHPMPVTQRDERGVPVRFSTAEEITQWGLETIARLGTVVAISIDLAQRGGNLSSAHDFRGDPLSTAPQTGQGPAPTQESSPAPAPFQQPTFQQAPAVSAATFGMGTAGIPNPAADPLATGIYSPSAAQAPAAQGLDVPGDGWIGGQEFDAGWDYTG